MCFLTLTINQDIAIQICCLANVTESVLAANLQEVVAIHFARLMSIVFLLGILCLDGCSLTNNHTQEVSGVTSALKFETELASASQSVKLLDNHPALTSEFAIHRPGIEASQPSTGAVGSYGTETTSSGPRVWGQAGLRGFLTGSQVAPNGIEFNPLFYLNLDFNFWLWRDENLYAYSETRFWGQKPAPGITNPNQGTFDFSKREFDLDVGLAWNYYEHFEARAFAYSLGNLNRGNSDTQPSGFMDGVGLENRWYVGGTYSDLGHPSFDVSRATFLSLGFYPTNQMVDVEGNGFRPGPFAHAYLTCDLFEKTYVYLDAKAIGTHSFTPKLLTFDQGIAFRPFSASTIIEFRLGADGKSDFQFHNVELTFYASVGFVY